MKNTTYNHHKKKQPKANKTYQRKENALKKGKQRLNRRLGKKNKKSNKLAAQCSS